MHGEGCIEAPILRYAADPGIAAPRFAAQPMLPLKTAHIFCRVVDNYGDIGVCWRLARQLAAEHGLAVTLWVDDMRSFHRICPELNPECEAQHVQGVSILRWAAPLSANSVPAIPDLVIEAFACELPAAYVQLMTQRQPHPVWINLEYLSAEDWVEGCHGLQSPHPTLPLTKYFFFPGFTGRTGGLLQERHLAAQRALWQEDPSNASAFLSRIGVHSSNVCRVSLFCYPSAPVAQLFRELAADPDPVLCLVPEGVASEAVSAFLQQPPVPGASATHASLTVQVIPFLEQADYDRLLWSCDLNFVRGEDSLVRAHWAGRPFIWQIYPQQENAHHVKLESFLAHYSLGMEDSLCPTVYACWQAWNTTGSATRFPWVELRSQLRQLTLHACSRARQLQQNGDLASNLLRFIKKIG